MDSDLQYLKQKVDMGADYIVTQMFFDNEKYYNFVKACREIGITVPIVPGLKPIYNKKQLTMLPKVFHIDLPTDLSNEIIKCKTDEEIEVVGQEWLLHQSKELIKYGIPVLHYYTLGKPNIVANVVKELV
jgi:methylenetetrahydrofolate reductase (NADPH)